MSPRFATFLMFVVNGAMIGCWLAHVPWIADHLQATRTEVGIAMLCLSGGAFASMTLTGQALTRTTSRSVLLPAAVLFPLLAPVPVLAPSLVTLALGMLVFGVVNGVMDVAMNAHGVAIERAARTPLMSSMHAGWSLGGLLGAATVAVAAVLGVAPPVTSLLTTLVLLGITLVAARSLGPGASGSTSGGGRFTLPSRAVLPLGLMGVLVAIVEGGVADWSGLYLERDLGLDPGIAALGFTAFALGLTGGRLAGDRLNRRLGAPALLSGGLVLSGVAMLAVLLVGDPRFALLGLVVAGAGVANGIPLLFSAGGHIKPSGPSLAAVFTLTYTAFLAGPPVIGFVADRIGMPATLGLVALVALAAAAVVPRVPGIQGAAHGRQPSAADAPA